MAAIFQVRRGSGSVSLNDGELYLHKSSGSLQVSLGTTPITLARLDEINSGSLVLSGDITASNAFISGNLHVSGNLFLGNQTSDTITATGEFTSDLIPNPSNTYSLGSTSKVWKNIYATSISGALAATNGVVSGSSQIALESINGFTTFNTTLSTITGSLISTASANTVSIFNLNTFSGSQLSQNSSLATITGSLLLTASNHEQRLGQIEIKSSSYDDRFTSLATISGSLILTASANTISINNLNTFSGSQLTQNSNLATISGSLISTASANTLSITELNLYSASLKNAIDLSGQDVTINGKLTVLGTTTQIDSTQVNIGENILELNYGGSATEAGIYAKDATGGSTISGSLLWDSNTDYWKAGTKNNESKILLAGGDNVISSSAQLTDLNTFTSSANIRLNNLESTSASVNTSVSNLNSTTASLNTSVSNINVSTSSLNTFSASVLSSLTSIYQTTASLNLFTASVTSSLESIYQTTSSLNIATSSLQSFSSSTLLRLTSLESETASLESRATSLGIITGSLILTASANTISITNLNTETASLESRATTLAQVTGSLISATASLFISSSQMTGAIAQLRQDVDGLILTSDVAALGASVTAIKIATASLNLFTSSQLNINAGYNTFTQSADVRLDNLELFTSSADVRLDNLESKSASVDVSITNINLFTQSSDQRLDSIESITSSFESLGRGILSSSIHEWPTSDGLVDQFLTTDGGGNLSFSNLDTMLEGIYTGEAITKGDPLYINGSNGANPIVYKADASDPSKMPVTYIAYETIGAGVGSRGIVLGLIEGMNLTGLAAGTEVYVAEGGGWSTSRPSGSNSIVQLLGIVTKEGNGGKGMVLNPGPANLPNLQTGKLWIGNATNQPVLVTTASFANTASFNSYTQSTNDRLTNLESGNSGDSVRLTNLELFTSSADVRLNNLQITSASHNVSIAQLNTYTSSLNTAIQLTGSTVSFLGNIVVYGTQSIINSTNLAINDNLIYLNEGSTVTNPDLGIAGNYNDGTYAHTGIFRDASDSGAWKVFKGYTPEPSGTIDTSHGSFQLADFKAATITGTTIVGSIAATNGVISGSAQISTIFEEKASSTHILFSGSSQVNADSITNFDSNVKDKLNADGVISGSSQLTTEFDSRYLNTNGDGVFSGSAQIPNASITNLQLQNSSITIAGTNVSLGSAISLSTITNGSGIISGSSQISSVFEEKASSTHTLFSGSSQVNADTITNFDANVLAYNNSLGVVSGSAQINVASTTGDIALGTRTSGNYVATITAGTGVSTTGASTGEGIAHTISIGQAVATTSNVQFGSIGVGTTASGVSGEIRATGDITAYYSSDERLKENIQPIENALSKVESISGKEYDWKEGFENIHSHTGHDLGVIAQEVQSILPNVVVERETGYLAVDYIKLVPVLIEAIKELSAKIKVLENK